MPLYLYSVDTGVQVEADNEEEALDRLECRDTEYCRVTHQDIMLVEVSNDGEVVDWCTNCEEMNPIMDLVDGLCDPCRTEQHDCSDADRPCDNCLTRNLPDHMDEP